MPNAGLTIDTTTFTDNPADYQVEFTGTVDDQEQQFAVKYSALEAWAGEQTLEDPLSVAQAQVVSCPLLSGPSTMTVWIKEGTTNAEQEADTRADHREAA